MGFLSVKSLAFDESALPNLLNKAGKKPLHYIANIISQMGSKEENFLTWTRATFLIADFPTFSTHFWLQLCTDFGGGNRGTGIRE